MPYNDKAKRRARYAQRKLEDPEWDARQRAASRERSRQWYRENRERRLAKAREWEAANPEDAAQRTARWRERNPDWSHQWYEANREHKLQQNKAWRQANPEWVRNQNYKRYSPRNEFVHALVVLERDDGVCGICGADVDPFDFQIDHVVPIARGGVHTYDNVQAAHPLCNRRKHTKLPEELAA